ncbi:hypothetical protein C8A05DRAFT_33360, partial [Staphylotrichum tortipilum]
DLGGEEEGGRVVRGIGEVVGRVSKVVGVVGVVAFSMGAKVATEVVRRLEGDGEREVKVVVAVCATAPYQGGGMMKEGAGEEERRAWEGRWREVLGREKVKAKSVHVIGGSDPWRGQSERLVELFGEEGRRVVRFDGGHHMPVEEKVNREIAKAVMEACGMV